LTEEVLDLCQARVITWGVKVTEGRHRLICSSRHCFIHLLNVDVV